MLNTSVNSARKQFSDQSIETMRILDLISSVSNAQSSMQKLLRERDTDTIESLVRIDSVQAQRQV